VKLTVYLFRSDAKSFAQLLRSDKEPAPASLKQELSVPCEAWVAPPFPHSPSWADTVAPLVETKDLRNASTSLLFLLQVDERYFAVAFGYASSLLREELLEHDFGLRVTANASDPGKIAALQVRTIDENSRQQRSQTTHRARVSDFDLEVEREWLRYMKGDALAAGDMAKSVGGSQSLSITTDKSTKDLPEILSWLLVQFHADAYKSKFPYIDNLAPVPKGDPFLRTCRQSSARQSLILTPSASGWLRPMIRWGRMLSTIRSSATECDDVSHSRSS
jgi:uncharacterized protein (TIGR04141 family)